MQEFKFNVTGTERKKLAGAISEILNTPIKYLGAPTFAYEVGSYHIDKNGMVTGEHDLNLFVGLAGRGFEPEQSRTFHLITPRGTLLIHDHFETAEEARAAGYGLYFDHETDGIWRQVWSKSDENHHTEFAVVGAPFEKPSASEEAPVEETTEATAAEEIPENDAPESPAVEENAADTAPEITQLVIEYPLDGFTPEAIDNLTKMVLAKEALLKKALGAEELPIQIPDDQRIAFPWFSIDTDSDAATAYAQFIAALCKTAKEKKRVTAKAPEAFENEKFAMRVWLIGLGMIGAEFGAARKLLMRNLSGDSGWRYGKPEKTAPIAEESPAEGENAGEVVDHE
ncbi:MAG: hypothetical protein LBQ15_07370 [Clostridium sp.]|nr:hypothetical protein [Clostridium sp.]